MKSLLAILCISFISTQGNSQDLRPVSGLPTKEVYDLMLDHRGYLWIAHDLGISRYDGVNFIHYSSENQASLSMTDLAEDAMGRVWCHNFSGQIFYIENQQMKLLDAYDYKRERQFPRLAICGGEILITSEYGLYAIETTTLKTKFYSFNKLYDNLTVSIAVLGDKAVLYSSDAWYVYTAKQGIRKIDSDPGIQIDKFNVISIEPGTLRDTVYMIANPSNLLQKLQVRGNKIMLVGQEKLSGFINVVTIDRGEAWVHTRSLSRTTNGRQFITDQNLTDIVTDNEGNSWYSSLKEGLLVSHKKPDWDIINLTTAGKDYARCITPVGKNFLIGTQKGELLLMDSAIKKKLWSYTLPSGDGAVEYIRDYDTNRYLVATSVTTYLVKPGSTKVEILQTVNTVKNVDFIDNTILFAAPNGLFIKPKGNIKDSASWLQKWLNRLPYLSGDRKKDTLYLIYRQRCRRIIYAKNQDLILGAFKNGLYKLENNAMVPYIVDNKQVMASSLEYNNGKLYIATFNNGLLIDSMGIIKKITTKDLLHSNTIIKTKLIHNHLWLFENNSIQIFDCLSEKIVNNIQLPDLLGDDGFDVTENHGAAYITTSHGIYQIAFKPIALAKMKSYIDYLLVNNRDTVYRSQTNLSYDQNYLQFFFSTPEYSNPQALLFNYRLVGSSDEQWHTTKPFERSLRYASLMPGHYSFELFPTYSNHVAFGAPVIFQFYITRPWWNKWWFYFLIFLTALSVLYIIYRFRIRQLLEMEYMRRKISSDLHDDIGATLSSINIYTALARKEKDSNQYINLIEMHSSEVIEKLDDLVWSINPNNDSCEQLINRMRSFAEPLLHASGIQCAFDYNESICRMHLDIPAKTNLFLIFKELINNVAKHAKATHCAINLDKDHNWFYLVVKDNGVGFDKELKNNRNGINNLRIRINEINADMNIETAPGAGTAVKISVPL